MTEPSADATVHAATTALPQLVALLEKALRPTHLGYATLVVRDYETTRAPAAVLATLRYRWQENAPPELMDESAHRAATVDPSTHLGIAPVWVFELMPIAADDWYLTHFFAEPVKHWDGDSAVSRQKGQGYLFRARRPKGEWKIEVTDTLLFA